MFAIGIAALIPIMFLAAGCGGPDNSAEVEKLKTPQPSNNPDVAAPSTADMQMNDDPKALKGKGPGASGAPGPD